MKRRRLTKAERATMTTRQGGCCFNFGCDGKPEIAEHYTPVALGNENKPDCLLCRECARRKTNGPRGDLTNIAKAKRISEKRTQYDRRQKRGPLLKSARKLIGRGFDKTLRKLFDGSVVKR